MVTPRPARTWRVGLVLVAFAVAALLTGGGSVAAHAVVVAIDPPNGAVVDQPPSTVTVTFDEPVTPAAEPGTVLDDRGAEVQLGATVLADELRIRLPNTLGDGTYIVTWHVISADAHPVAGSSIFHIGAPSTTAPTAPRVDAAAGIDTVRALLNAVLYGAALVAIGAAWFARRWQSGAVGRLAHRGAIVGLAAVVPVAAARVVELDGSWSALADGDAWRRTLDGPIGLSILLLTLGLATLVIAGLRPATTSPWISLVGSTLVVAGFCLDGHTRSATPAVLVIAADLIHVAAAAVWLGGIAALTVARRSDDSTRWRVHTIDVSTHAIWAVAAVTAAGVAMAITIAPSVDSITSTRWGATLTVKVVLVAGLVGLGAYNRFRVLPRLASQTNSDGAGTTLRHTLRAELALFAAILIATGTLVDSAPTDTTKPPAASPISRRLELDSGTGDAKFDLTPAQLGYNDLYLQLTDSGGNPLELIWDPIVELAAPERGIEPVQLSVHDVGNSSYHIPVEIPLAGRWQIIVHARTGTFETGTATLDVTIVR